MSQIIEKMQEGGMFKYPSGEIETERLVRAINGNMDLYLKSLNWTRKRKQRFLNSVDKFITGILEGNIYEMSNNGTFYDKKGTISDNTGTKFFKEDKEAATFIKWVLDSQDPYVKKEEVNIEKSKEANFDLAFAKALNKKLFSTDSDELDLRQLENISGEYLRKYRSLLFETILPNLEMENWGKYQNKDNYVNQVKKANERLGKKHKEGSLTTEDIKRELSGLNIEPYFIDSLFSAATKKINNNSPNPVKENPLKSYLYSNDVQRWWNQNKDKSLALPNIRMGQTLFEKSLDHEHLNFDEYVERFLSNLSNFNYTNYNNFVSRDLNLPIFNSNGWGYDNNTTYAQLTSDILNYLITTGNNKYITPIDNGNGYAILPTLSVKSKGTGLITVYNPTNKKLILIPAYFLINDPKVGELIRLQLRPEPKPDLSVPSIPWNKEGGVLKYQFGGTSDYFTLVFKEIIDDNINKSNNIFDKVTWDYDTRYKHSKKDSKSPLELITRTDKDFTTDKIATGNNYYDPEDYGKDVENLSWWKNWTNQLTSNEKLAENWAKKYIELNRTTGNNFKSKWFDASGKFLFDKFKEDEKLWTDKQNGPGHDVNKGYVYELNGEYLNDDDLTAKGIDLNNYISKDESYPDLPLITVKSLSLKDNANSEENQSTNNDLTDNKKGKESTATANELNIDDFIKDNWQRWIVPSLGSFYRFHNTSKANKDLLNESLNSIKPLYEDPKRFERNIYGDYASLSLHDENAARINTMSAKPLTSSGDLQAARLLEGEKAASQERTLGLQANSAAIKQSIEQALAQAKLNMEWEVDNTNSNRQRAWTSELLKSQARQGYISKQAQNRDIFSKELLQFYQNYLDKKTELGQSAISAYQQLMFTNNPELQAYTNKFKDMINKGQDYTTTKEYQDYLNKINELGKKQIVFNINALGNLYGVNDFKSLNRLLPAIKFSKEGGTINRERIQKMKIKLEEQKLFLKSIIESIKENNKPINNLSNTMQKLLLKMLK